MKNNQPLLTFGPVNSRRFGISLGIDLSPEYKQCNFDCLYCELKGSNTVFKQNVSIEPELYIDEVQKALIKFPEIEVLTITANGEPTLYPFLDKLIDKLNKIKSDKKLLILTNAGLINNQNIKNILKKIDIVKVSLDCVTKECFNKLDRIDKTIKYNDILNGIVKFSKEYKKELIVEILFVDTINNNKNEIKLLRDLLDEIDPIRVDIGTIDRPPAYNVKPISYEELYNISKIFENQNISISHRNKIKLDKFLAKDEILNLLDKRPQTHEDIENLLNKSSMKIFKKLQKENIIGIEERTGIKFYIRLI